MKTGFFVEVKVLAYSEELIDELWWIHAEILSVFFREDVADQLNKSIQYAFWLLVLCEVLLVLQILSKEHKEIETDLHRIDSVVHDLAAISLNG